MQRPRPIERLASWVSRPSEADRAAGLELAVASRRFSRRTKAVVDDKLSFSAALMRAGEVEAANRMLAEVHEEVLTEEVALLERVNEVKVAQSMQPPVTRARLARTLAVAMIGSSLLAFSAAGAMVAGFFDNEDQAIHGRQPGADVDAAGEAGGDRVKGVRQIRIANVPMTLTSAQFRRYTELTTGKIDEDGLELFLLELLPPALAEKVHFALIAGLETLPEPVEDEIVALAERFDEQRRSAAADEESEPQPEEASTDEPHPSPEPSDSGTPSEEPTPAPTEEPEDEGELPFFDDDDEEGN